MASRKAIVMITPNSAKKIMKGTKNMAKQVIFHEDYYLEYTFDPAAKPGRMEAIMEELRDYSIISPAFKNMVRAFPSNSKHSSRRFLFSDGSDVSQ